MKKTFVFIILLVFLLGTYNNVFADYKIILKNGGKFIANDYKKEGSSIKLYTPNGEIEIDQSNIESIKSVDVDIEDKTAVKPAEKTEEKKKSVLKTTEDPFEPLTKIDAPEVKISDTEKKNIELKTEKDKLEAESKKLEEDFKKEGRLMPIRKKRELEQRSQYLNKKIKEYNDEIEKLKKENKSIQ